MRPLSAAVLVALAVSACAKPEYLETDPKEVSFKKRGENIWARVLAKDRTGKIYPGIKGSWSSSDLKVASVDGDGKLFAVGPGKATVTVKAEGFSVELPVEVITCEKVTIAPAELTLKTGDEPVEFTSTALDAQGKPLTRKGLSWCKSEEVCRAVDGKVFPAGVGTTVLIVSVDGVKAEVPVTVTKGKKD